MRASGIAGLGVAVAAGFALAVVLLAGGTVGLLVLLVIALPVALMHLVGVAVSGVAGRRVLRGELLGGWLLFGSALTVPGLLLASYVERVQGEQSWVAGTIAGVARLGVGLAVAGPLLYLVGRRSSRGSGSWAVLAIVLAFAALLALLVLGVEARS